MKRIANILIFLLLSITAFAQRFPISVTTILTPPYTTSLSTMAESGSTRLMVNLLVNDVTITEIPVKLHIKMESAGVTIESIPTQVVRPMFLGGGEARVLTGDDFAEYLRLNNLNFKGFSKAAYQKSGHLPAGLWKFSVSVRHFYTNKVISNVGTATAWITSYKPPVLTYPKEGENAPSNAALPLSFSWQASKFTGGATAVMYRFEMWERRIEGVPAQAVAATIPPIYSTETAGLTATVLPASLALEPGMKYCWRVTAYDPSGMVTIENKGESEVRTFQYLEKCPEVCGLTVDIKDDTGYASWEENRQHLGGYNFEFYDDEGTCHKTLWGSTTKTAGIGGEYGKTWHVRVQGICLSDVHSKWSEWVDFKIPDAFKPLKDENGNTFECGKETPERVITNFTLRDNLQKGDTIETEPGTTKFVIHSATRNEDGSFRGLSYVLMRIWGVSFLGEFDHLNVNTDGVIIGKCAWRTVNMGPGVVTPEDIERWADETALAIAGATYNNTIKDTVSLCCGIKFESIRREGNRYYALRGDTLPVEITSAINGRTRVLVKDGDGHELVIDKDGNVMGVEEYKKCGGSKALLRENIKEKDSQVTKSGNVKFFGTGDYLFDTYDNYSGKTGYAERFPSIGEGDYKPAYACVESNTKLEIKAEPYKTYTFKNERGVPVLCKDGILEVTARGDRDTTSIYAYDADNHIVGKVNVLSYDKVTRKICLVPIGDTKAPDASAVKQGLDEIFAKLMVDFDVTIGEPITIQYAKDNIFTHGGSGMIGVYNADQKAAISKLKERGIDEETCYLFLVKDCKALKANDEQDVVNGYMPRGYQFGFIYNQTSNTRTIAHELCHGAFHLKHTFDATDYLAPEGETNNLMDYTEGQLTTLNHWQWKDIHQPKSVRFKWLQDEEGAESATVTKPQEVVDDIIEKLRCANQSGRNKIFIGSKSHVLNDVFSQSLGFRVDCQFGDKSSKTYDTYEITLPYKRTSYNESKYLYDFGEVQFYVTKANGEKFEKYLNDTSFDSQINSIRTLLKNGKTSSALEILFRSSYCVFEKLTNEERKQLINGLKNQWTLPECDEFMLLNLLRASASNTDDAKDMLVYIFGSNAETFSKLCSKVDNFNGYGSYNEFMKVLVELYVQAYKDDKERGFYISRMGNKLISVNFYTDEWQEELKGSSIHLYNGVYNINCAKHFYDTQNKYWATEYGVFPLTPLTMITIHFSRSVSGFNAGDEVTMPMFYYAYLLNINLSEYKAEIFDDVLLIISVLKAGYALKYGYKVLSLIGLFSTVTDPTLNIIDKIVKSYKNDHPEEIENTDFGSFYNVWRDIYDIYQVTSSTKSLMTDFSLIISKLKGENVLETINDGLNTINLYLSKSSEFTQEQIEEFHKFQEQIKSTINENNVIY